MALAEDIERLKDINKCIKAMSLPSQTGNWVDILHDEKMRLSTKIVPQLIRRIEELEASLETVRDRAEGLVFRIENTPAIGPGMTVLQDSLPLKDLKEALSAQD